LHCYPCMLDRFSPLSVMAVFAFYNNARWHDLTLGYDRL
jgi:hypothetical protein